MKYKLFKTLTLMGIVSLPVLAIISCSSSSWTRWNKNNNIPTKIKYQEKDKINSNAYSFDPSTINDKYTIDDKNVFTIDMEKVNNQFELKAIITEINNFKTSTNIDLFWNDLTDNDIYNDSRLLDYLDTLNTKSTINLKYYSMVETIIWDITESTTIIKKGFSNYAKYLGDDSFANIKHLSPEKDNRNYLPSQITISDIKNKLLRKIEDNKISKLLLDSDIIIMEANDIEGRLQIAIKNHTILPLIYNIMGFKKDETQLSPLTNPIGKYKSTQDDLGEILKTFKANNPLFNYLKIVEYTSSGEGDSTNLIDKNHFVTNIVFKKLKINLDDNIQSINKEKAYDVSVNGINSSSSPRDLANVNNVATNLLGNESVNSLLNVNPNLALALAKLANLPRESFEGFTMLINSVDKFWDMFKLDNSLLMKSWFSMEKKIGKQKWYTSFEINDKGNKIDSNHGIAFIKGVYLEKGISVK